MTRMKTWVLGAVTLTAVFGGIGVSAALGFWNTESSKEPAKIQSGEFAGLPSPSDIRGSYAWSDVAKAFDVPVASLIAAFGASGPDETVNSLEARYAGALVAGSEIGTDSVRLFVSLYTGLPHEAEPDTVLPASALPVLRAEGKADAALLEAVGARALGGDGMPTMSPAAAEPEPPADADAHGASAGAITGKTTFGDLESWGFDMRKVSELLGGLGPSDQSVRDYCASKGVEFSTVKGGLGELAP